MIACMTASAVMIFKFELFPTTSKSIHSIPATVSFQHDALCPANIKMLASDCKNLPLVLFCYNIFFINYRITYIHIALTFLRLYRKF